MEDIEERKKLLIKLLNMEGDLEDISQGLRAFTWDVENELVTLTGGNLKNAFELVLNSSKSIKDLERWGDLIECREDIDYEENNLDLIEEVIGLLANSEINEPISNSVIENWVKKVR